MIFSVEIVICAGPAPMRCRPRQHRIKKPNAPDGANAVAGVRQNRERLAASLRLMGSPEHKRASLQCNKLSFLCICAPDNYDDNTIRYWACKGIAPHVARGGQRSLWERSRRPVMYGTVYRSVFRRTHQWRCVSGRGGGLWQIGGRLLLVGQAWPVQTGHLSSLKEDDHA